MKKSLLSVLIALLGIIAINGQSLPGFKYQSVIRDSNGEIVADKQVRLRISILEGSVTGNAVLQEVFNPKTNEFGLVNVVIGSEKPEDFAAIQWQNTNYFMKVELDAAGGTNYTTMGTSQLLSVPYAQYAFSAGEWKNIDETVYTLKNVGIGTSEPTGRLKVVQADDAKDDDPIFEVVNNKGEVVFAVYNNRVEINFEDDGTDKARGGFAVSGRTSTKEEYREIFTVRSDETRVYVDDFGDKARGGFAVSGRTSTKNEYADIFRVQPHLTQIFVDEFDDKARGGFAVSGRTSTKDMFEDIFVVQPGITQVFVDEQSKARGGFAVSGRTSTKDLYDDIFTVKPGLTQVFVEETTSKARGGFAVSGRTSTKDDGMYDVFSVRPERTDIFINPTGQKFFDDGFSISMYGHDFDTTELFAVSEMGAVVNIGMAVAPRVTTLDVDEVTITETSVVAQGRVLAYGGTDIVKRGIVYSTTPDPSIKPSYPDPSQAGMLVEIVENNGFGMFGFEIENLLPGTKYYFKAFAVNEDELVGFGTVKSFTTSALELSFEVIDESEQSIDDAVITLTSHIYPHVITNEPGDYVFDVALGIYSYEVYVAGYYKATGTVDVASDGQTELVVMQAAPAEVSFIVTDEDGNPVSNIEINVFDNVENSMWRITDENGVAVFNPEPGTWYYSFFDYYYGIYDLPQEVEFTVEPDEVSTIEVVLEKLPTYEVTFKVTDWDGLPVEGAEVYLYQGGYKNNSKSEKEGDFYGQTDQEGVLVFENVPEGVYWYDVFHSEYGYDYNEVTINEDKVIEVELMPM